MTGYGRAEGAIGNAKVIVELRSLNSKQLDLYVRTPGVYKEKEVELRTEVANDLVRGKVELNIGREAVHEEKRTEFDEDMIAGYFKELNSIKEKVDPNGSTDMLAFVLRMPEVTKTSKHKLDENEWSEVHALFRKAIEELDAFRAKEGAQLEKDIRLHLDNIRDLLTKVEILDQGRTDAIKERLKG